MLRFTMLRSTLPIVLLLLASNVVAQNSIPILNSNENAALTIYLDFNGHDTNKTEWNKGQRNNNNTGWDWKPIENIHTDAFDNVDLIHDIWARVAEDYAPFNVNVTTHLEGESPNGFEASLLRTSTTDTEYGVRAVIGNNSAWYGNAGGVAYINTFGIPDGTMGPNGPVSNSYLGPAFIFTNNLTRTPEKSIAEAISHEVGHNLGLSHDGSPRDGEYHKGDNGWAPIMGTSYYQDVTQWDEGTYTGATNQEDDLAVINEWLDYRDDDFGGVEKVNKDGTVNGTIALLEDFVDEKISDPLTKSFYVEGFIEQNTDVDMFQFILGEGDDFSFEIDSGIYHEDDANLDVLAKLYYGGTTPESVVYEWNPIDTMGIGEVLSLSDLLNGLNGIFDLVAGTYFLSLEGTGLIKEGIEIYSDYASIGTYRFSGWYGYAELPNGNPVPEPATLAMFGLGLAGLGIAARRRS